MGSSSRIWVIGGVLIALAILGGGYLIGVAPALEGAKAADVAVEQVEAQNEVQRAEIERLKQLELDKESIAAQLLILQKSIPAIHDLSPYDGRLADYAAAADVKVLEISYEEEYVATAPTAEETADADAAAADSAAADAGLVAMPTKLVMQAKAGKLIAWLKQLQYGERFFAIQHISVDSDNRGEADSTLRMEVHGFLFVLPDTAKDTEIANGGTTPPGEVDASAEVN